MSRWRGDTIRARLLEFQGWRCCYCGGHVVVGKSYGPRIPRGTKVPDNTATLEHLRQKSEGGTSAHDNLAVACHRCNSQRGRRSWVEYKTLMSEKRMQ